MRKVEITHPLIKRKNSDTSSAPTIPVLSFFTGAGFLDIGFMQANFQPIWHNEFNKSFVKGFEFAMESMRHKSVRVENTSSITDIGPNRIAKEAFSNLPRPGVFGIIGGPPCPDFSVGGKNRGGSGDHGRLSQVYVNRIIELDPTFFLFENVPGLLRTWKHRLFLEQLRNQLEKHFVISQRVLNALEFGVPQDRARLFLIGFNRRWINKKTLYSAGSNVEWFPWPEDIRYKGAKTKFPWPKEITFGRNPKRPDGIPSELMVGPMICSTAISSLPNGNDVFLARSKKITQISEGDVSRKSFKRLHRWRFSPTVAYGNNEVHLHPILPRRLTVREAMRLQSVPDSYALPSELPLSHKYKMIGNGVPVKLAYVLASAIRKVICEN